MAQTSLWTVLISSNLRLSFLWPVVYPLILSRDPKIVRKPVRTGPMSSSLVEIGAIPSDREKSLRSGNPGELPGRGSADADSRSPRRFIVLKCISRKLNFLQRVERETREETVVRHELAEHTRPNEAFRRRGKAVAISAILSSVRLKAHPRVLEQGDPSKRSTNP